MDVVRADRKGIAMKVYSVAMTEVQDDSVICDSMVCKTWKDAENEARNFIKRCVHDFYIDDSEAERSKRLKAYLYREKTKEPDGMRKLEMHFDYADLSGMLVLATCVKEVEVYDSIYTGKAKAVD